MQPVMTAAEVKSYLEEVFPQTAHLFEIDEIALVSSDTLPTGAVYETIATFPISRPGA